jgi:DNA polymerase-3 subunit delta
MIYKSYILEQNVNSIDENIGLFYGVNLGLKNDLKAKILENYKNSEILRYSQDELLKNKTLLENEIKNISLFEKNKIFFIENANDKILDLVQEFEDILSDRKIFLFSDVLDKKSKLRNYTEKSKKCACIACYEDNEASIKKLINSKLNGFNGLSPYNINLIIEHTNLDRSKLNNELNKIISCFPNKNILNDKLEILLNAKTNNDFNKLKDEAFLGNRINTNKLLAQTGMDNEKNIFYLNIINQRLDKLLQIHNFGKSKIEDAINSLKPPVFWKDKPNLTNQAGKWDKFKVQKMINLTFNLEKKIKSNNLIEKNILIKKLLVDICSLANV